MVYKILYYLFQPHHSCPQYSVKTEALTALSTPLVYWTTQQCIVISRLVFLVECQLTIILPKHLSFCLIKFWLLEHCYYDNYVCRCNDSGISFSFLFLKTDTTM